MVVRKAVVYSENWSRCKLEEDGRKMARSWHTVYIDDVKPLFLLLCMFESYTGYCKDSCCTAF